jgi:surface antigen
MYSLYTGCEAASLWRAAGAAAVLTLGLACGGCSIGQLDNVWGSADKADQTGSIPASQAAKPAGDLPPDSDLVFTKAAVSQVLSRSGSDASEPWENPRSGARGTVTPITAAYTQSGQTCRDFLASYVKGSSEAWWQGAACKEQKGAWEVRSLKPWKRS